MSDNLRKQKAKNKSKRIIILDLFRIHANQILLAVLLITVMIYTRSFSQPFMIGWDDGEYISNPDIQNLSATNVGKYFSTFYLGMYQPIPVLTFALNYHFSGDNPLGYHIFNLLIHLVNIVLVYYLVRKLAGNDIAGLTAALLLAIHPMNVESIAWLSARSTGLFTMFYLLALMAYLRYLRNGLILRGLIPVFLFFTASLFSKSMAATLPMVLIMMDFWSRRRLNKKTIIEKLPFFAMSVIFGMISIRAAASFGHITVLEIDYAISDRIFLLSYAVCFYLVKLLVPVQLSAIFAYPGKDGGWLPDVYYLSLGAVLLIAFGIFRLRRYRHETSLGVIFFLLSIAMVLPLFWSRLFIVAERYVYLPYVGLFFIAGTWLNALIKKEIQVGINTRKWILGCVAAWVLILGTSSFFRIPIWQDTPTLMKDVIDKNRSPADQAFAWFFLGNISDREGDVQQAIRNYSLAVSLNPGHIQALNNRGIMLGTLGDFEGSLNDFNEAIRLKPGYAEAFYNRGIVFYQVNKYEEACKDWQHAAWLEFRQAEEVLRKYCKGMY